MKNSLFIFIILVLTSTLVSQAASPFDNFNDGNDRNVNNSIYYSYTDGFSTQKILWDQPAGLTGNYFCAKNEWEIRKGGKTRFAGFGCNIYPGGTPANLSEYYGVRFKAKGTGNVTIQLPTTATATESNHFEKKITLESNWKTFELPFRRFLIPWGTKHTFNPAEVVAFQITVFDAAGTKGVIYIDDIEFYKKEEGVPESDYNPIVRSPKVNQVGYLPLSDKWFTVTFPYGKPDQTYTIIDTVTGNEVYSGKTENKLFALDSATREQVVRGNFSAFSQAGVFRIKIDTLTSAPFKINRDVFLNLYKDAFRAFSVIRCGTAVSDGENNIFHSTCHTHDNFIRGENSSDNDFTGGWHNGADFGKWTHMSAISIANFLWLYELKQDNTDNFNIPESGNALPDLLDEAKWGLTWLLKMQQPDGSVFHKVDSEPDFPEAKSPENDSLKRFAAFQAATQPQIPSTVDAGNFTAIMLQAARVFKEKDPEFAEKCRNAGLLTWDWINNNPGKNQTDIYFADNSWEEELIWAEAEVLRTIEDPELLSHFPVRLLSVPAESAGWDKPQAFAYLTSLFNNKLDDTQKDRIRNAIRETTDDLVKFTEENGYVNSQLSTHYWWGSTEYMLHKANMLLIAYEMTRDLKYKNAAHAQLNYILGLNSLNQSFVTGSGTHTVKKPYHWTYLSGFYLPGWASSGPNGYNDAIDPLLRDLISEGTPAAKCYLDEATSAGSWSSNEGQITENSALVFLAGYMHIDIDPVKEEVVENNNFTAAVDDQKITLFIDSKENQNSEVILADLLGRKILQQKFDLKKGKNILEVTPSQSMEVIVIKVLFSSESKSMKLGNMH
jgi:endoglucanase